MRRAISALSALGLLALLLPGLAACSTNPATGEQSFTAFMSPDEEKRVGTQEHPKILKEFGGAYSDPKLANYIRQLGEKLGRVSEYPDMKFTFTVLNDDNVNAFALPGGYVYITRGLLAIADNEAEVAGVLGHEIGHITARHSAQRYSQAMAANIGLTILGVIGSAAGVPAAAGDLAQLGAGAALQSYSRDQELQADMLGVRYITKLGYSPDAMTSFFRKLDAHTRLTATIAGNPGAADRYNIMSTHPRTTDRIQQAIQLASATTVPNPKFERTAFLNAIDGMTFGDDPKQGVRRGREFLHPDLGIRFQVPPSFTLFNSPSQVLARGPQNSAVVFDMEKEQKARTVSDISAYVARDWGGKLGLRDVERIDVNGLAAATGQTRVSTRSGTMDVRLVAYKASADHIYRFVFMTPPALTGQLATELQRTTYSFRTLSREETATVRPLRIGLVTVKQGDTAQSISARMPFDSYKLEWFEVINGLARGQQLVPGTVMKTVE